MPFPPVALLRLAVIVLLLITLQMTEVRLTFSLHAEKLGMYGLCGNEFALSSRFPLCFPNQDSPIQLKSQHLAAVPDATPKAERKPTTSVKRIRRQNQ